ncbi:hypothetical protein [Campylobacter upsaliensis]|uniref:hypothetical protein n=1 Tax=Campylobacter upsaliensis TaxID=28080 RepID=UPI002149EC30|nr:hypothetical protein [Campylobacter upsaliensis]MCR2090684.1 hypothetical protein [Campylobacter upsaliensis]
MQELKMHLKKMSELNYNLLMSNIIIHSKIDEKDKQILLQCLQDRDRNYVRLNDNEQVYENIKKYLNLLRPLALPFENLVRVGGFNDGGYVMFNALSAGGGGGGAPSLGGGNFFLGVWKWGNFGFKGLGMGKFLKMPL